VRRGLLGLLILVGMAACDSQALDRTPDGSAAIRSLARRQAEAWNRHDAKAYADLFSVDCDVVNIVGEWWNGREELERKLTTVFSTMFKNSELTFTDVQFRLLTPQLAIAHMRWTMTGAIPPRGSPQPKQGIQTLVVRKQDGKWLIDVFQNTNAISGGD
jgi:uncharacterized protein (TIGR02246 family)